MNAEIEKYFEEEIKGRKQSAIASAVRDALENFCDQEQEFEQAILQSGKSFQECLNSVVENCGSCLSDIEAYRRAVKFYFTTATVSFVMTIDLCGDNGADKPPITMTQSKSLRVSLEALLDF